MKFNECIPMHAFFPNTVIYLSPMSTYPFLSIIFFVIMYMLRLPFSLPSLGYMYLPHFPLHRTNATTNITTETSFFVPSLIAFLFLISNWIEFYCVLSRLIHCSRQLMGIHEHQMFVEHTNRGNPASYVIKMNRKP